MEKSHYINGWEREKRFHDGLRIGLQQNRDFKARTLSKIVKTIDPSFSKGLFEYHPCKRRLKYIGTPDAFFQIGEVYESIMFNGATYKFSGYDGAIGYTYFEWVDW